MRITRLVAGLVTAGLVGLVPLAATAPANAAGTQASTTTLTLSPSFDGGPFEIGDTLNFTGTVTGADGTSTPNSTNGGTATLLVSSPSNPTFTPIATDTGGSLYFSVQASTNATYKVSYSGGISGFGTSATTLTGSESAPIGVAVARTLKIKTNNLTINGKVLPSFGKEKIKILKKAGKKYKKYTSVKTNKKGKFTFRAPRKNKFRFAVVVPGNALYSAAVEYYIVRIF